MNQTIIRRKERQQTQKKLTEVQISWLVYIHLAEWLTKRWLLAGYSWYTGELSDGKSTGEKNNDGLTSLSCYLIGNILRGELADKYLIDWLTNGIVW